MKKTVVLYYSNNGSNRFLAKQLGERLGAPVEEIRPLLDIHPMLLFGLSPGNKRLRSDLTLYDRVILCGPIWMGKFIAPLKDFVRKYKDKIREIMFITCCGSSFEIKDEKFGHGRVFQQVEEMLDDKCSRCEAFPITLVVPDDKKEDGNTIMNTRLSKENFTGEIRERFDAFIQSISD